MAEIGSPISSKAKLAADSSHIFSIKHIISASIEILQVLFSESEIILFPMVVVFIMKKVLTCPRGVHQR